jgi:hypothetical protein
MLRLQFVRTELAMHDIRQRSYNWHVLSYSFRFVTMIVEVKSRR